MSTQTSPGLPQEYISEDQVAEYLRRHPEFFENRGSLLEQLRLPHHVSGAVSLIERQVSVLRGKNQTLENKLRALLKAANASETLSSRLHHLALALIAADTLDDVLATAQERLIQAFSADHAIVRLLHDEAENMGILYASHAEVTRLFADAYQSRRPICGTLSQRQIEFLFGEATGQIGSAVMVPLAQTGAIGFIALGSKDPRRFNAGMGTLFLGYLGDLVTQAVVSHRDRQRGS